MPVYTANLVQLSQCSQGVFRKTQIINIKELYYRIYSWKEVKLPWVKVCGVSMRRKVCFCFCGHPYLVWTQFDLLAPKWLGGPGQNVKTNSGHSSFTVLFIIDTRYAELYFTVKTITYHTKIEPLYCTLPNYLVAATFKCFFLWHMIGMEIRLVMIKWFCSLPFYMQDFYRTRYRQLLKYFV
jgi:hypothetical protein